MKNILPLCTLLLIPPLVFASAPQHKKRHLEGLYVKAGVGDTIAQFDTTQEYTAILLNQLPIDNVTFNLSVDHKSQGTQFAGLVGIGYLYQVNALWVIAGELTANFTSANASYKNNTNILNLDHFNSENNLNYYNDFALLFKPGLAIQQRTQFYALIGPRWGNFKTTTESEVSILGSTGANSTSATGYQIGLTVGLGVERLITSQWGVAFEYAYTAYNKFPSSDASFTYDPNVAGFYSASITDKLSGSAATNTLMLEITHRFW